MNNSKIIKNLQEIKNTIDLTISNIEKDGTFKEHLKMLNIGLDKQLGKLVKDLNGESFYYKKNNESAWDLAMGEVT